VYGGGGVTPDVIVADDTLTSAEQQLLKTLAPKQQEVTTALQDYALELSKQVSKDFQVQPAWRDEWRRRIDARGIKVDPQQWEGGSRWVSQQLEFWISRFAFGDSTAKRRGLVYDAPLRRAIDMMNKGQTQKDLFTLAAIKPLNDAKPAKNQAAAAAVEVPRQRP
jgi:carboxyl-terminal processing protease